MCCSPLLILGMFVFGVFALAKGELRITGSKKVTDTTARILGGSLLVGAALGFVNPIISLVVLVLVIAFGLFLMEEAVVGTKEQKDEIFRSDDPYHAGKISPNTGTNRGGAFQSQPTNNTPMDFRSDFNGFSNQAANGMPSLNHIDADDASPTIPVYSEYIVYNMRSSFKKKPGQPNRCPKCGAALKGSNLKPSQSVRSDLFSKELLTNHRYSYLFTCGNCQWWCFRENWKSNTLNNYICDFLVAGAIHGSALSSNLYSSPTLTEQPWILALQEQNLYSQSENLPPDLAQIFPVS